LFVLVGLSPTQTKPSLPGGRNLLIIVDLREVTTMWSVALRTIYGMLVATLIASVIGLALLAAISPSANAVTLDAQQRWSIHGLTNYRLAVRVEYRGESCFQQFDVRFGRVADVLHNSCDVSWLNILTVPELFELAHEIETIPTSRCYPSSRWCVCQRIFSDRLIQYDDEFGYPAVVLSRSDLYPHWTGLDFWERLSQTHALPSCGPAQRRLTVQVVALTPLSVVSTQ
jgi:hypothetical protein